MNYFIKLQFIYILLCLLIFTSTRGAKKANSSSHHITFGTQGEREVHLARFAARETFKRMKTLNNDFVYKPKPNDPHFSRTITRIVVIDLYRNGKGGYAKLKDGGPSTNYAVLSLKSQRNHGYNFLIDIFGI